ncbi:MAG: OB-fold nucleic acid binding domain-containing protein, partial [Clostridiales bacterium]|nr:OB-fold nucleic acid binding domain-containing protein [Clostridiales bacterium]
MAKKFQPESEQSLSEILQIRRDKLTALQEAGRDPYRETNYDVTHHAADINDHYEEMEGQIVSLAGRLMSKRGMGKVSFCDLQDNSGRIQLYVRRDLVGEEEYAWFKKCDIGDIVGVRGEVFKTEKGQISVRASSVTLLSKSLQPLPEKFHGLTDRETRYRQRYVDLIVNPEVKDTFVKRSMIMRELRAFLDGRGFLEVDPPIRAPGEGGAAA